MPTAPKPALRHPIGKVTANGTALHFTSFEVIQNAHHASDTFQVIIPLFDPKAPFDWVWWADQTDIEIEIMIGLADDNGNPGTMTSLIVGPVDAVAMAPLSYGYNQGGGRRGPSAEVGAGGLVAHAGGPSHPTGSVLTIRGRDYSGQLQDSQMSQQFTGNNLSASKVIPQIVAQVPQLSVDMAAASDQIEDDYNGGGGRLFLNRSPWDVITALADHEGYKVRVQGRTVKVQPDTSPDTSNAFEIFYIPASGAGDSYQEAQSNCVTLRMSRALNIGKGIDVFVNAYDTSSGRRPSRKQAKVRNSKSTKTGPTYTFNRPGMSAAQAQKHAKAKAGQIAQFEREIEFQIPGDPAIKVDRAITLTGTGTKFDQSYFPDQIDHRYSVETGYAMEVRARNKSRDATISEADATGAAPASTATAKTIPAIPPPKPAP